jgi:hypothetical protein
MCRLSDWAYLRDCKLERTDEYAHCSDSSREWVFIHLATNFCCFTMVYHVRAKADTLTPYSVRTSAFCSTTHKRLPANAFPPPFSICSPTMRLEDKSNCHLADIFNELGTYQYLEMQKPNPELECFICKGPYQPHDPEGCHAIEPHPSGHIIGHECFKEWNNRNPQACPYRSHHLPEAIIPDENIGVTLLRWVVNSHWIALIEHLTRFENWVEKRHPYNYGKPREAFRAMATRTLDKRDVKNLIFWNRVFVLGIGSGASAVASMVSVLTVCTTWQLVHWILLRSIGYEPRYRAGVWQAGWTFLLCTGLFLCANACAYDFIVGRVLELGLRRSILRQRKQRKGPKKTSSKGA